MRTVSNYRLQSETWEEQQAAGRFNPGCVVVLSSGVRLIIAAGDADDVHVLAEGDLWFVVSMNRCLDYVGCEVFSASGEAMGDVFCQGQEQYEEVLGKAGLDLRPTTIAKRLADYALCE